MPKKLKKPTTPKTTSAKALSKSNNDFFFLTTMSVFAALTIFAAQFLINTKREAIEQARRYQESLSVAQLELVDPSPTPSPSPLSVKPTPRPTTSPNSKPMELKLSN